MSLLTYDTKAELTSYRNIYSRLQGSEFCFWMNHSIYIAKAVLSRFKSRTRYTSINPKFHPEFGIFLFLDESVDLCCESRFDFLPQYLFSTLKIRVLFLDKLFDLFCESSAFAVQIFYSDTNMAVRSAARSSVSSIKIFSDGL
jgi:hypothetical protein